MNDEELMEFELTNMNPFPGAELDPLELPEVLPMIFNKQAD